MFIMLDMTGVTYAFYEREKRKEKKQRKITNKANKPKEKKGKMCDTLQMHTYIIPVAISCLCGQYWLMLLLVSTVESSKPPAAVTFHDSRYMPSDTVSDDSSKELRIVGLFIGGSQLKPPYGIADLKRR